MDLHNAHEMFGLNYTVFRPHNVYGANQNINDKYRNVVGIFMKQIANGEALTIFGNGEQSRAFSFIDDVAPYIAESVHLMTTQNEVFNIGGGQPFTVNELGIAVMKAMNSKVEINHLEERNEVVHAYSSHEKFNKVFKPEKETTLEEGLKQMATWVKAWLQAPKRVSKSKFKNQGTQIPDIEIEKNLPNSWKNNR